MEADNHRRRIEILPADVARRIAAGEVIERPASVIRELIDNSIDAGASSIEIRWDGGGIESMLVRDDGRGMGMDDLALCPREHATSKIRTIEDLEHTTSLGFRGEALASISAVSELTITSALPEESRAHRLRVDFGEERDVETVAGPPGTTVEVRRLFANLPARRNFLSRAAAEATAIRNTILDKALPVPALRLSYGASDRSPQVLAPETLLERVAAVFGNRIPPQKLHEIYGGGEGFAIRLIAAEPEIARRDRRLIQVFVNGRRIWEYKLIQGIEYAYQDVQHGGLFPAVALLVDIDPELVDFNIHPAKREARIRNLPEVRGRVVELLRSFLRAWVVKRVQLGEELWKRGERPGSLNPEHGSGGGGSPGAFSASGSRRDVAPPPGGPVSAYTPGRTGPASVPFGHQHRAVPGRTTDDMAAAESPTEDDRLRYVGTLFETFVVVELDQQAYVIDQHAAHERILYDRFSTARSSQGLLVPEEFEVTADQDGALERHREAYAELGISLERVGGRRWSLTAIPPAYREQTEDLIETIAELGGLEEEFDRKFLAQMACKAAVRAGDYLDEISALELARRTLALPVPRCPHGRPLWLELDRESLEKLIGRR